MKLRRMVFCIVAVLGLPASQVLGQQVRFYEENGVTFQETVSTIQRPIVQTEWQQREQTVYRRQLNGKLQDTLRTYYTPVTEHRWITRLHGRYNPFVTPYFTHDLVPVTRWERRAEVVSLPVYEAQWVPETRTVSVPVTTLRMADEKVVNRIPVGPATTGAPLNRIVVRQSRPAVAFGTAMDGDPPRQGLRWRPPDTVLR